MSILIVGNIINDVYLNLDSRTEKFETDKHGTKWLDLSFNASEHHYFNRNNYLAGAAVSFEVFKKLGIDATVSGTKLELSENGVSADETSNVCRYILVADNDPCYLAPSGFQSTSFSTPDNAYDYLYIDRSAELDAASVHKIISYLEISSRTKLVLYIRTLNNANLNQLVPHADLVFLEDTPTNTAALKLSPLQNFEPSKIVHISENKLSYQNITESISVKRIDTLTHLSAYSIASATVLGCFMLGKTVEESLRIARLNLENSKPSYSLSLHELQEISENQVSNADIELVAKNLVLYPKGILAADESGGSIHKKFEQLQIPDTVENRRDYRNIFFTTPNLEKHVNGVILFDETARQFADNGQNFVDFLTAKRIIPGIKVDQGLEKFSDSTPQGAESSANPEETWTKGLDGLENRLKEYFEMGLRFAKWRAAFEIRLDDQGNIYTPTDSAIEINCQILADYALKCQQAGIVPIVEPEVVYDGNYSIDQNASTTSKILDCLFDKLKTTGVNLRACILKVNMVLAGKQQESQSTSAEVGARTAEVLKNHVPAELAGVVFLSGGQTVEQATDNLAEVTKNGPFPWPVTFSFARALQDPALYAWQGDNNNAKKARENFLARLIANTDALKVSKA